MASEPDKERCPEVTVEDREGDDSMSEADRGQPCKDTVVLTIAPFPLEVREELALIDERNQRYYELKEALLQAGKNPFTHELLQFWLKRTVSLRLYRGLYTDFHLWSRENPTSPVDEMLEVTSKGEPFKCLLDEYHGLLARGCSRYIERVLEKRWKRPIKCEAYCSTHKDYAEKVTASDYHLRVGPGELVYVELHGIY